MLLNSSLTQYMVYAKLYITQHIVMLGVIHKPRGDNHLESVYSIFSTIWPQSQGINRSEKTPDEKELERIREKQQTSLCAVRKGIPEMEITRNRRSPIWSSLEKGDH